MGSPAKSASAAASAERPLVITRVFDAPREAVFSAWTDPTQIASWLGPGDIRAEAKAMDPRPQGAFRIALHGKTGIVNIAGGVYREVVPPERLVFTWTWELDGGKTPKGHEMLITVTFQAKGRQTEMTLHQINFASDESRDKHTHGWSGSFDKLAALLRGGEERSEAHH
jgi:uncharacterized protein YndB with AHSA1/START domain